MQDPKRENSTKHLIFGSLLDSSNRAEELDYYHSLQASNLVILQYCITTLAP